MFTWILALHVIAIIATMAGLLYIFRLYVYHSMETETVVMERFQVMERRLLNMITTPALLVAFLTGVAMLVMNPALLHQPWMHLKLLCVVGIFGCHGIAMSYRKKLLIDPHVKPDKFFRIVNEIPTVLMIIIVIAVIVKPFAR